MTEGLRVLLVRAAYAVALMGAVAWAFLFLSVSASNGTLGYDFRAYDLAVDRLLAGQSMYDLNVSSMGAFGLFFYPPPFAILVLPVALLPTNIGLAVWLLGLALAFVAAVALMPVSLRTRLIVLLLGALCWPLIYAIKLGQVGPVLLLLFSIGWRWLDRPWAVGLTAGLGTIIKIQPALIIGWALITGRRRAAIVGIAVVALLALVATVVAGPQSWADEATALGHVSRPVLAENDTGFGHLAYLAGAPIAVATAIHWANVALVLLVTALVVWRGSPVASYVAVVIASQFVSPVLWDHYALILLLPVAWLIDRGRIWAALIPLVTGTFLIGTTPTIAYPILFWVALLAVAWEGLRTRDAGGAGASPITAAA